MSLIPFLANTAQWSVCENIFKPGYSSFFLFGQTSSVCFGFAADMLVMWIAWPPFTHSFEITTYHYFCSLCLPSFWAWVRDQNLTIKQTIVSERDAKLTTFSKAPHKSNGQFHMSTNHVAYTKVINSSWCGYMWELLRNPNCKVCHWIKVWFLPSLLW